MIERACGEGGEEEMQLVDAKISLGMKGLLCHAAALGFHSCSMRKRQRNNILGIIRVIAQFVMILTNISLACQELAGDQKYP